MIVLGRSLSKEDIEYEVNVENGSTIAAVTLQCLDVPQTFVGEAVMGSRGTAKKLAEFKAAEVALATFQEVVDLKRPEHEARKLEKLEEQRAKKALLRATQKSEGLD